MQRGLGQVALVAQVGLASGAEQGLVVPLGAGGRRRGQRLPVVVDLVVVGHHEAAQAAQHRLRANAAVQVLVGHTQPVSSVAQAGLVLRRGAGSGVEQAGGGIGINLVAGQHQKAGAVRVVKRVQPPRQAQQGSVGRARQLRAAGLVVLRRAVHQPGWVVTAAESEAEGRWFTGRRTQGRARWRSAAGHVLAVQINQAAAQPGWRLVAFEKFLHRCPPIGGCPAAGLRRVGLVKQHQQQNPGLALAQLGPAGAGEAGLEGRGQGRGGPSKMQHVAGHVALARAVQQVEIDQRPDA